MPDQKHVTEHRRLTVLKHLDQSPSYTSNASILQDVANGVGVSTNRDQMAATLAWLEEQELINLEVHGDFSVATATPRGVEVAKGQSVHPGVKRPSAR